MRLRASNGGYWVRVMKSAVVSLIEAWLPPSLRPYFATMGRWYRITRAEINRDWVAKMFAAVPALAQMGHHQTIEDSNLGLGWIYYGLARTIRPKTVVVIGSYRGFAPLVLGRALKENLNGGRVIFLDPSLVDDFWKEPEAVRKHFARFGVTNIQHFLMTTQQFSQSNAYRSLDEVGMVFVDG